jgi:predicted component of type VI protein secretion system
MSDDDDTDRWRSPRRGQTANDRDLAARRRNAPALGVPVLKATKGDPDITDAFEMLEREPDDEARAIVQRSRRNSGDPATVDDLAKVFVALYRERSANEQRNKDAEAVLAGPHKAMRASRRHLIAAVIAAGASVASAIAGARHATETPPSAGEQLQHQIDRLDSELREIRFQLSNKGPVP